MALISLHQVTLSLGGPPIFDALSLQIEAGDRLCLLGRNGSGKSTLMKLLSGYDYHYQGTVARQQGLRTALIPQDIPLDIQGSVFDVTAEGLGEVTSLLKAYHHAAAALATDTSAAAFSLLEKRQKQLEALGGWDLEQKVERVLSKLNLDPEALYSSLSGGTKRRVLLAKALVSEADLLLLDEPTNHLDVDTILWLEEFLLTQVKSFVFVTHDRAFARRVSNRIAEIDRGKLYAFDCGYDQFLERKASVLEAQEKAEMEFDKRLAQEEVWIRKGVKARLHRNEGRVKALEIMRRDRQERREIQGSVKMQISQAQRSGDLIAEIKDLNFSWDTKPLINGLTTTLMRGDRVGIIGPNGAGKTTLIRLLLGELAPLGGSVRQGAGIQVLYSDQLRSGLDGEKTIFENLGEGYDTVNVGGKARHVLAYLEDFLFSSDRAKTPVHVLSGGEKNRLMLAKLFTKPSNVLVLDEPTNDLDTQTLELLEDLLADYPGTILLVSHDREFMNHVITSSLVLLPQGEVREVVGGWDEARAFQSRFVQGNNEIKPAVIKPKSEKKEKLTFKEERELESLPVQIESWEEEKTKVQEKLYDPMIYKNDPSQAPRLKETLEELEQKLLKAYERWEVLEAKKN